MSFVNRIRNRYQVTRGRARQKLGRATGNRRMQAEGVANRIGGNVRQAGEHLKGTRRGLGRGRRR